MQYSLQYFQPRRENAKKKHVIFQLFLYKLLVFFCLRKNLCRSKKRCNRAYRKKATFAN